jgi:hypothetical protein
MPLYIGKIVDGQFAVTVRFERERVDMSVIPKQHFFSPDLSGDCLHAQRKGSAFSLRESIGSRAASR